MQILRSCSSRFISLRQSLSTEAAVAVGTTKSAEELLEPFDTAEIVVRTVSAPAELARFAEEAILARLVEELAAGSSRITTSSVLESRLQRYCLYSSCCC